MSDSSDSDLPPEVEWGDWGKPVRVRIDPGPVALFARAVKDETAYSSDGAVPVPPTFTFVMAHAGAFPDLQAGGVVPSMYPEGGLGLDRKGLFLHGEQHFTYHRPVVVGDELVGRRRVSKPIARTARRGPMEITYFQTRWSDLDGTPVVDEQIVSLFFPAG
ncbi:MAG: MaoC family dehydratase N-terminal domain-containing protein [Actinomycetota bacterium]|nr:MaoC family dehydratase N-terminal domain-containing protein [Actinomycetota bacterium]